MPVEVVWDDEAHTILRQIYRGAISVAEYYQATQQVVEMAATVEHTVHMIFDRRAVTSVPRRLLPVLRYANSKVPRNAGLRLILGASFSTRITVDMGRIVAPQLIQHVLFVSSLEEAYAIIQRQR